MTTRKKVYASPIEPARCRIAVHAAAIQAAHEAIADELEAAARAAVGRLAEFYPDQKVGFVSAMGSWFFYLGERMAGDCRETYAHDPGNNFPAAARRHVAATLTLFRSVLDDHGWGAIPAPVRYDKRAGAEQPFVRRTDW